MALMTGGQYIESLRKVQYNGIYNHAYTVIQNDLKTIFVKKTKEWVITGAAKQPYEIDDAENGITIEEIKKAMADREVYLADVKKRQEEYQATKETPSVANASAPAAAGGFNF